MGLPEYRVVMGGTLPQLESKVSKLLVSGWMPFGDLRDTEHDYRQVMLKPAGKDAVEEQLANIVSVLKEIRDLTKQPAKK